MRKGNADVGLPMNDGQQMMVALCHQTVLAISEDQSAMHMSATKGVVDQPWREFRLVISK